MKKVIGFLFFVSILIFSACAPTTEQAAAYNDTIIAEQTLIIEKIDAVTESFVDYIPEVMDKASKEASDQVNKGIANVTAFEKFDKTNDYKDAALELFNVYKSVIDGEFKKMIAIYKIPDEDFKDEHYQQFDELQTAAQDKMDKAEAKFVAFQEEFAKKYNLILTK